MGKSEKKVFKMPKDAILTAAQTEALLKRLKAKAVKPVNGMYDLSKLCGKNKGWFVVENPQYDERLWK